MSPENTVDQTEQVDETNYPGAQSEQPEVEGQESKPVQTEQTDTSADTDWRVKKYGEDWEHSVDYWKDTSTYWREETRKKNARAERTIEDVVKPTPAARDTTPKPVDEETNVEDLTSVKDLVGYMKREQERLFDQKLSERSIEDRFKSSMQSARSEYTGDKEAGIPSFVELEQEILIPLCEKQPQILQLIKTMDDPKAAAYTLGMMLKLQGGFFDVLRGQGRADLTKKINDTTKEAVRMKQAKGGVRSSKQTAADIWNMKPEDFEKESAKVIHSGR